MSARVVTPIAVAAVAATAAVTHATFGAFWSRDANPNNGYQAGNVYITDNAAGVRMLSLTSAIPGNSDTSCISVTYSGSLSSTVKLYATTTGTIAPYLNVVVTRGTTTTGFDNCIGFAADATDYLGAGPGVAYSGLLSAFPTTYATGIADPASGPAETWTTSEVHAYRFVVTLADNNSAQGQAGSATFTWEAINV